jgi:phosphoenolpyruvate synthase/pyruvate phosphate dikinase
MFFEEDRLPTVRRMILNAHLATAAKAKDEADREPRRSGRRCRVFDEALAELEKLQTDDFAGCSARWTACRSSSASSTRRSTSSCPSHDELVADTTRLRTTLELTGRRRCRLVQQGLVKLFGKKDAARAMRKLEAVGSRAGAPAVPAPDRSAPWRRSSPRRTELLHAVEAMREQNPMLGLRGVRLGLMVPDIVKMQTRAILAGAAAWRPRA